jgi:DHA1 family multidrug resistance protein-like MFS transporter
MLFAARMIGGTLSGGMYPSSLAYIADITEHEDRGRIMGLLGAASSLGMIFGPSISGILSIWGLSVPFFATAIAAIIFGIFGYFFLEESKSVDVHHPVRKRKSSLIAPLRTPLAILFILMLMVTFLISGFQGMFAYYMLGRFGLGDGPSPVPILGGTLTLTGPTTVAMLFTIMGIAGVLCQGFLVVISIRRFGESKTILIGMIMTAIAFFLLIFSGELLTVLLFSSLMVVGTGLATPCLNSLVSQDTDEEHQGAALGVLGSYGAMGRIIGAPVAGLAFDANIYLPYVISGIISAMGAVSMFWVRKNRKH